MHDAVRVAEAAYGLGVFADETFPARSVVGWLRGRLIEDEDYASDYCIDLGNGVSLEPDAPFRFVNHSCEPNCELYIVEHEDDSTGAVHSEVCLEAIEEIFPGEELTIDYGWPADCAIPCGCASPNCRGWIVASDELHLLPGRRQKRTAI